MKRVILLFSLLSIYMLNLSAQGYSNDAMLVQNINDKIAVLNCSGLAEKRKDAEQMAVKSAIYTYLFNGIDGLNRGLPLLGTKPSPSAEAYVNNLMQSGRYNVFVKGYTVDAEATRKIGKQDQVYIKLELYTESLYKDLVNAKIISAT